MCQPSPPCLATPRPLLDWLLLSICLWLWLSRFCCRAATDIDFHTRATAAEQQRQQLQRRCCSRMIPALERRSCHNFLIIRKILCQQKRRTACTGSPKGVCHTHTDGSCGAPSFMQHFWVAIASSCCNQNEFVQLCSTFKYNQQCACVCFVCVCVCVSSKFYISSIFVWFAGKNAWQKFFKRCQHPSLCLWLDFRCILTLFSSLSLSPFLTLHLSRFLSNFWHISANTFPTSFSITLMEAQRQKIPKFDFDFGILLNGFIHKLSRLSSVAHLTRFSWADKWQLIARPNEYPSQRQKTTKKLNDRGGRGKHNANNKTGYKTLSYAVNWSVTQWTKELGVPRHTDTHTHTLAHRQVKQKRNSWNANWIWWEKKSKQRHKKS